MDIRELAARKVANKEQIERLQDDNKMIDDKIRKEHEYGKHDAGEWTVSVEHNRTFNKAKFMEAFPVVNHPEFYAPTPNLDAVKNKLSPEQLEAFYNEGDPKVLVR